MSDSDQPEPLAADMTPSTSGQDQLHRFTFENLPVRGQWVRLSQTTRAAHAVNEYPDAVKKLLNEMFAVVAMFADNLKFDGAIALQSRGSQGALIRTLAECRERQYLRGIAHLDAQQNPPQNSNSLAAWLGEGQLALSLIPPTDADQVPYQGLVALQDGSLAENLEGYMLNSEQLPSRMFLVSTPTSVTGLLLQRLPDQDLASEISLDQAQDAWHSIVTLANTVTDEELLDLPAQTLLSRLFAEYPCRLYPPRPLSYRCTCSRGKSDRTLRVLDANEIRALFAELGEITVDCEFCGTRYRYDAVDIGTLINGDPGTPTPDTLH
ncbi:MAG: Hsp33 family molecular chaperone HslO [bacterium]